MRMIPLVSMIFRSKWNIVRFTGDVVLDGKYNPIRKFVCYSTKSQAVAWNQVNSYVSQRQACQTEEVLHPVTPFGGYGLM